MRTLLSTCLALAFTGCIQDVDVMLEPDPTGPDGGSGPDARPLARPAIVVAPTAVVFTAPGERVALRVENHGDAPLMIGGVLRNGAPAFAVTLDGHNALAGVEPRAVAPGEGITFEVEALAEPPAQAELVFVSDDPERPELRVPIGYAGAPCLRAEPAALDFARVAPGSAEAAEIRLHNCGDRPIALASIALDGESPAFSLIAPLPAGPIEAGAAVAVGVVFEPQGEGVARDTLRVEADGVALAVPLGGRGAPPSCPVAIPDREPLRVAREPVQLDATAALIGEPGAGASFEWAVIDRPAGSAASIVEAFTDPARPDNGGSAPDAATPVDWFMPDRYGRYHFELRYRDLEGCAVDAGLAVHVRGEGFAIEVDWQTPGALADGEGADLDLHLVHPAADDWFSRIYDCHYASPTPDWGQPGNSLDDPALVLDAVGRGPERITLGNPENTATLGAPYLAGVHYYAYEAATPPAEPVPVTATLRVWIDDEPVAELSREIGSGQLWHAFDIDWPSAEVTARDALADRDAPAPR